MLHSSNLQSYFYQRARENKKKTVFALTKWSSLFAICVCSWIRTHQCGPRCLLVPFLAHLNCQPNEKTNHCHFSIWHIIQDIVRSVLICLCWCVCLCECNCHVLWLCCHSVKMNHFIITFFLLLVSGSHWSEPLTRLIFNDLVLFFGWIALSTPKWKKKSNYSKCESDCLILQISPRKKKHSKHSIVIK